MLKFLIVAAVITMAWQAKAETCFDATPLETFDLENCGSVTCQLTIKDCATGVVEESFKAPMGVSCLEKPPRLRLLYGRRMFVQEISTLEAKPQFKFSKSYVEDWSREPAEAKPRGQKGAQCFTMTPKEYINAETCDPVKVDIQYRSCKSRKAEGPKIEATAHFSCGDIPVLKYWHKKHMLVGELRKTDKGYKVIRTYTVVYPMIYSTYNGPSSH